MRYLVTFVLFIALSACTSVKVKPVDASLNIQNVCIQENQKVTLDGFIPMLEEGFARHGISTRVIPDHRTCEFVLTYTALRSWDVTVYLSHAELHLLHNGQEIASAEYHLRAKGGFSLTKFKRVQSKMDPVIDELLGDYSAPVAAVHSDTVYSANTSAELEQLEALRQRGVISDQEFEEEKRQLLKSN
jgi:hypothetical protein